MNPLFDANISKIAELLDYILTHKPAKGKEPPPEFEQLLSKIQAHLAIMKKTNDEIQEIIGKSPHEQLVEVLSSPDVPNKEKRALLRSKKIEHDLKTCSETLKKIQSNKTPSKKNTPKNDEPKSKQAKERQKRFKPLGSDKGWIPM